MNPAAFAGALAQAALALGAGHLLASWVLRRARVENVGGPERLLLAVAGFVAIACLAMVGNLMTGGAVFGVAAVVPVCLAVVVVIWVARRPRPSLGTIPASVWLLAAVLVGLYVVPVLLGGSGIRTGDPPWHLGWTEQLLAGEAVPTGPAPELARNAYPWGLHAVLATMTRMVPGTDPSIAYEALHLVVLVALPAAAASLARTVDRRAGVAAAVCVALIGGFGWIVAGGPAFIASPEQARFGADLVVASPNSVYELFPPGFPRELGLALLGAAGWALMGASDHRGRARIGGVLAGLAGLVSVPMFVAASIWCLATIAVAPRGRRRSLATDLLIPAVVTFALWAGPVVAAYLRYGGFVDITPQLGKEWPLPVALASWGLLAPAAAFGIVTVIRGREPLRRSLLALAAATAALLTLAIARGAFDWSLAGNATLLHQGRVWPVAHLLAAALAGVGLARLFVWLRARGRALAVGTMTLVVGVGAVSPTLAAVQMTDILETNRSGFYYDRIDLDPGGFVGSAAAHLGPDDVVEVVDGSAPQAAGDLAWFLWQFSGCRLASYDDPRLDRNELRIRYADLAAEWDERMATGGFAPTHVVASPSVAPDGEVLVSGEFAGDTWVLVRLSRL